MAGGKIGDVYYVASIDASGIPQLAKKEGEKAGKAFGTTMSGGIKKQLKGVFSGGKGEILGALGIGAGIGLATVALSKLVGVMGDSIDAASDQREAFSLTDQVFEENTASMKEWAAGAADAFGQSTTEALTFASNFGTAFKNVGFNLDEAAEKSKTMTRLAADLGSAMNATGEEAATALRSGLLGESEPLRRFGVFLSEAAVQAEAVSSGIAKQGDVLTDNQKVLARYNIIMRQTKDSQGAFGRDTGSLADAQKKLEAAFEDAQAALGEALRPAMIEVVNFVNKEFIPAVKGLGDALADLGEDTRSNEDIFGNFLNILDDISERGNESKTALGALDETLTNLADDLIDAATFWDGYTLATEDQAQAAEDAAEANREAGRGIGVAESAAADATPVIQELGETAKKAGRKIVTAGTTAGISFKQWRDDVIGYAQDIVDKAYQIIEDKAALTAQAVEDAELRKVIATGKATDEQKARYQELGQEQIDTVLSLVANGITAGKELDRAMTNLRNRLKTAVGQERKAILAAIALVERLQRAAEAARLKIKTAVDLAKLGMGSQGLIGGNWTGNASGGPIQAGETSWVGERGQPELFTPNVSGRIANMAEIRAALSVPTSGGGDTINIPLSITGLPMQAETPADVVREMRRATRLGLAPAVRKRGFG